MPYFDLDPIDPALDLAGDLGPGRENRPDDRIKLASAIEKKTGAAPHADLGRFGGTLSRRFAGRPGGRKSAALSPGFLGAIGAAQARRGTDPDTVVLKDGPTRDALRGAGGTGGPGGPDAGGGFAPLPTLKKPVGPRTPNLPQDRRTLQGKLASLGYVPRVTEKPLFPGSAAGRPLTPPFHPPGGGTVRDAAGALQTLLDGVRRFQQREGLKKDGLVNPGGPTERALDARNERARHARLERLETVSREIMDSDDPDFSAVSDRSAADSLGGLIVAGEVQDQRKARLDEPTGRAETGGKRPKFDGNQTSPNSTEKPNDAAQKTNEEERNGFSDGNWSDSLGFSERSTFFDKPLEDYLKLLRQKSYWKNRATYLSILAEIQGERDITRFVNERIKTERKETKEQLERTPSEMNAGIVLTGGRRPRRPQLPGIGSQITQRGIDLRAERLLKQIRKYDPGFWQHQFRSPGKSSRFTRDNIRFFEEQLVRYQARAAAKARKKPGMAWSSGKLPILRPGQKWLRGTHRNAGFIPEHIAAKLRGRSFRNFDHFRAEFWKEVAADPITRRGFSARDLREMRKGRAPEADELQHFRGQKSFHIHHAEPLWSGGPIYDMRKVTVLTPRMHHEILLPEHHFGTGLSR